jgi:hypothetical protein
MPGISHAGNVVTIGSTPPVTIEILADRKDSKKVEFKINGRYFSWSDSQSFKQNAEAIGRLLESDFAQKPAKKSAWLDAGNFLASLFVPSAHAEEEKKISLTTALLVGAIAAIVIGLVAYNWGKKNGKTEGKAEAEDDNTIADLRAEIDELKGIESSSSSDSDTSH